MLGAVFNTNQPRRSQNPNSRPKMGQVCASGSRLRKSAGLSSGPPLPLPHSTRGGLRREWSCPGHLPLLPSTLPQLLQTQGTLAPGTRCQVFTHHLPNSAAGGERATAWVGAAGSGPAGPQAEPAPAEHTLKPAMESPAEPAAPRLGPTPGPPAAAHSPLHSAEYWSPQSPDCGLQPPPPAGASCCCRCCSSCLSRDSGE